MRNKPWAAAVAATALLSGCARPGNTPDYLAEATRPQASVAISVGPAPSPLAAYAMVVPAERMGEASCTWVAEALASQYPSAPADVNDPGQRRALALLQQQPIPRRGPLPEDARLGAEACVRYLRLEFTLRTNGFSKPLEQQAIGEVLGHAGLTAVAILPRPAFRASTGKACVYGTFAPADPTFAVGPLAADGTCPA